VSKDARVLVAEFLGTFALTFFGAASIVSTAALRAAELGSRATPANITRTFGTIDLLFIAFAHAIVLAVMITALGHISGGHFNPAVTVGALIGRHIEPTLAAMYIVIQLMAGLVAALLIKYLYAADLLQTVKWGAPSPAVDTAKAVGVEAVRTFFLVTVVYATAIDPRGAFNKVAGFAIGLVLLFDILVGGPMTGAAMNPARAFGPALLAGIVDANHFLIYWIGPLLGAAVAAVLYQQLLLKGDEASELPPPAEEQSGA
jgi:MIP family channel proteins